MLLITVIVLFSAQVMIMIDKIIQTKLKINNYDIKSKLFFLMSLVTLESVPQWLGYLHYQYYDFLYIFSMCETWQAFSYEGLTCTVAFCLFVSSHQSIGVDVVVRKEVVGRFHAESKTNDGITALRSSMWAHFFLWWAEPVCVGRLPHG